NTSQARAADAERINRAHLRNIHRRFRQSSLVERRRLGGIQLGGIRFVCFALLEYSCCRIRFIFKSSRGWSTPVAIKRRERFIVGFVALEVWGARFASVAIGAGAAFLTSAARVAPAAIAGVASPVVV